MNEKPLAVIKLDPHLFDEVVKSDLFFVDAPPNPNLAKGDICEVWREDPLGGFKASTKRRIVAIFPDQISPSAISKYGLSWKPNDDPDLVPLPPLPYGYEWMSEMFGPHGDSHTAVALSGNATIPALEPVGWVNGIQTDGRFLWDWSCDGKGRIGLSRRECVMGLAAHVRRRERMKGW